MEGYSNYHLKIRLYWQHDPDLAALASCPGFRAGAAIRDALRAYVRDENAAIALPEDIPPCRIVTREVTLVLNPTEDADIIRFLDSVEDGYRCAAVKAIFRKYLEKVCIGPFMAGTGFVRKSTVSGHRKTRSYVAPMKGREDQNLPRGGATGGKAPGAGRNGTGAAETAGAMAAAHEKKAPAPTGRQETDAADSFDLWDAMDRI